MSHLDDEGGHRAGVGGAGVGDLDVLEAGVVDHLAPLVPVDVGRGTRAVLHPALEPHWGPLVYVEIFRPDNHCPGF